MHAVGSHVRPGFNPNNIVASVNSVAALMTSRNIVTPQ
jgi:hypothetical protein